MTSQLCCSSYQNVINSPFSSLFNFFLHTFPQGVIFSFILISTTSNILQLFILYELQVTMLVFKTKTRPHRSNCPSGTSFWAPFLIHFLFLKPKAKSRTLYTDNSLKLPINTHCWWKDIARFVDSCHEQSGMAGLNRPAFGDSLTCSPHYWHNHSRLMMALQGSNHIPYTASIIRPEFLQMVKTNKPLTVYSVSFHCHIARGELQEQDFRTEIPLGSVEPEGCRQC